MHLFLPFASSLLYVTAALFLRQAAREGAGPWRTGFICNTVAAGLFLGLLPFGGQWPGLALIWQPFVVACFFVSGQILTFFALEKGDVSVATPVMGCKLIIVAFLAATLTTEVVTASLWCAAILSTLGIAFLNRGPSQKHRYVLRTILLAFLAGASYAFFDVLIMKWAPAWGAGRFLPTAMLMAGILSLGFVPLFRQPLTQLPRPAIRPLFLGAFFMAMQAIILVSGLAIFGDATAMNVIYSLRGLWSVAAVWFIGHWFANDEREVGAITMRWRLLGAMCLSAAVVLLFV